jgi:hypothetical protein
MSRQANVSVGRPEAHLGHASLAAWSSFCDEEQATVAVDVSIAPY